MIGRTWIAPVATLMLLGVWCGCERHDWQGSTSELYEPHHGDHSGKKDHDGSPSEHATDSSPAEKSHGEDEKAAAEEKHSTADKPKKEERKSRKVFSG